MLLRTGSEDLKGLPFEEVRSQYILTVIVRAQMYTVGQSPIKGLQEYSLVTKEGYQVN